QPTVIAFALFAPRWNPHLAGTEKFCNQLFSRPRFHAGAMIGALTPAWAGGRAKSELRPAKAPVSAIHGEAAYEEEQEERDRWTEKCPYPAATGQTHR